MTGRTSLGPAPVLALLVVAVAMAPPTGGATAVDAPASDALATNATVPQNATGRFDDRVVSTHRGDVLAIRILNAANHRVVLGSPDSGFEVSFTVASGGAKVRLNTYKAGQSGYPPGEVVWAESGQITDVRVEPGSIDEPLEVGRYPMNVSFNGTESDVGSFYVTERSTNYSSGWALPEGFSVDGDTTADAVAEAGENRTNNLSVASGDWLALEVNASGLYGVLAKDGLDGDDGISVEFVQQNPPPNHDPNTFEGDDADHLLADPDNERFFLLVDTQRHDVEPGDVYDVTFSVAPESGLVDQAENLTTTFRVLEREVDVFYRGRKLIANGSGKTVVAGNATMVAGTTFRVRAKSTGANPFLMTKVVRLDDESAFEAAFDFSPYPSGTNFTILVPETGLSVPAVVGERETPTPTPTATPTPTPTPTVTPTPSPTPTPALTYATRTPLPARTVTESDGQPGFGPLAGTAALLVAVLLARRRGRWGS